MESQFDKNVEFLYTHFPRLLKNILPEDKCAPYTFLQNPRPNIWCKKHTFHSKADPEREALRSVQNIHVREGTLILFLGLGLGYHVEKFMELYNTAGARVVVVEKSAEAFTLLIKNRDISFLQDVKLFIAETPSSVIDYFESLSPVSFRGHRVIRLRGAFELFSQYYTKIQSAFAALMSARLSDMLTRFAFESLWLKNFISNIPLLAGKRSIAALKGALEKNPAIVIGAGPSLKNQLPLIARIAPSVHIIAVDTVVGPLVMRGIIPDFIVTLDAQYFNAYDFFSLFSDVHTAEPVYRRSVLVADIVVCPQILKNWKGDVYFSETSYSPALNQAGSNGKEQQEAHSLSPLLHTYFHDIDSLECGGSVATTAIELALYLGADPVLVTGLDLSYTGYQTHVASSPFYNKLFRTSCRFNTLHTGITRAIKKRDIMFVPGIGGKPVLSDFVFINYLKWIESRAKYKNRVLNITKSGAVIGNIKHRSIEELIGGRLFSKEEGTLPSHRSRPFSHVDAEGFLSRLEHELNEARTALNSIFDAHTFMHSFPFLRNSVLEALRLYSTDAGVEHYLRTLLGFLEQHIQRAEKSFEKG